MGLGQNEIRSAIASTRLELTDSRPKGARVNTACERHRYSFKSDPLTVGGWRFLKLVGV